MVRGEFGFPQPPILSLSTGHGRSRYFFLGLLSRRQKVWSGPTWNRRKWGLVEADKKKGYQNGDEVTSRNFLTKGQCFFLFLPLFSGQSSTDQKHGKTRCWLLDAAPRIQLKPWIQKAVEHSTTGSATFLVNASGHIAAVFVCRIPLVFCNLLV